MGVWSNVAMLQGWQTGRLGGRAVMLYPGMARQCDIFLRVTIGKHPVQECTAR